MQRCDFGSERVKTSFCPNEANALSLKTLETRVFKNSILNIISAAEKKKKSVSVNSTSSASALVADDKSEEEEEDSNRYVSRETEMLKFDWLISMIIL